MIDDKPITITTMTFAKSVPMSPFALGFLLHYRWSAEQHPSVEAGGGDRDTIEKFLAIGLIRTTGKDTYSLTKYGDKCVDRILDAAASICMLDE